MLLFTAGLFDWSMQHQSSEGPPPKQVTPEEQKWWVTPAIKRVEAALQYLQRVMYASSRPIKLGHDQQDTRKC
jgi:hypothetical protein